MLFWREQLVPTDYGYIYYSNRSDVPPAPEPSKGTESTLGGTVCYLDKDFNLLRIRHFKHPGMGGFVDLCPFDDVSIIRSRHNTTYLATRSNRHYEQTHDDCYLYEYDDDIEGTQEQVPLIHEAHRGVYDFDFVAENKAVEVGDDYSLFFCYSLNVGVSLSGDSWVVMERLDNDFNTITEVYYSTDYDRLWYCAESITMARDGGVLMTAQSRDLNNMSQWGSVVVKFPAESFESIEEAHDNGLKVAIAYPNPGKDVLNIRTALQNAHVEVYDINGRLVHSQALTDNVTAIEAGDWAKGTYVWKVYTSVSTGSTTLAETGKWIKE